MVDISKNATQVEENLPWIQKAIQQRMHKYDIQTWLKEQASLTNQRPNSLWYKMKNALALIKSQGILRTIKNLFSNLKSQRNEDK